MTLAARPDLPSPGAVGVTPARINDAVARNRALAPNGVLFTVFLGALSALPPLSIDMGLPGLPAIEASMPGALGHGALTLSLFLAGFAVSPLSAGPIADRFGRRPTMIGGLLAFSLAAAACTIAPSFPVLLLCRLLQGFAAGSCVIMPLAIVRDVFEGKTARHHMSQIAAVVGVAPMLAPMLGGWVVTISGWRMIYGAQAICGLLLLAVTVAFFAETLPQTRRRVLHPAAILASYRMVLRDRAFRGNSLLYAFTFACMFSFISSAPAVLMGSMGLTPTTFALVFGLTSCCAIGGSVGNGWLNARHVASTAIIGWAATGLLGAAVVLLAITLSGAVHVVTAVLPVAVVMFCFGLIGPSSNHEALQGLGAVAGSAAGVLRCLQMVMGALASAAVAMLQPEGVPLLAMAGLMMAASLAAAIVLTWLRFGAAARGVIPALQAVAETP